MTENYDGLAARLTFGCQKRSAESWMNSEDVKKRRRNAERLNLFRSVAADEVKSVVAERGDAFEVRSAIAKGLKKNVAETAAGHVLLHVFHRQNIKVAGRFEIEWTKKNGVDDAENCGVGTNTEGEGENRHDGEPGIFSEDAEGVAK